MIKKSLTIFILVLFLPVFSFGAPSSASYKITAKSIDSGSATGSSASYRLLGKIRERRVGTISGASLMIGQGFLKSAYFSKVIILAPVITSITPNRAINTGSINITDLAGANFLSGAAVKLSKSGQPDIAATGVLVAGLEKITCVFDLSGAISGLWDISVTNPDGRSGTLPAAFEISYRAPTVTSITPGRGFNNAVINIADLSGTGFRSGAEVKLLKTGENDIIGSNIVVVSSTKITCQFNLTGKAVGSWDVAVTNDDDQSGSLFQEFIIEAPELEIIGGVKNTPNPFNPGTGPTVISYNLSKDADITIYIYSIRGERLWQWVAPAGTPGGQAGSNEVIWSGITAYKAVASFGVYILTVTAKVDGKIRTLGKRKIAIIK